MSKQPDSYEALMAATGIDLEPETEPRSPEPQTLPRPRRRTQARPFPVSEPQPARALWSYAEEPETGTLELSNGRGQCWAIETGERGGMAYARAQVAGTYIETTGSSCLGRLGALIKAAYMARGLDK